MTPSTHYTATSQYVASYVPAVTLNTFMALDGKAFVAAANIAARRIDARQFLQFQKWNSTCARAMIYSALRCRSR